MEDNQISHFLTRIGSELSNHRMVMEKSAAQLTPKFNLFEVCEVNWLYENHMSRIIKKLLDPKGDHAQGAKFLAEFCKLIGVTVADFGEGGFAAAYVPEKEVSGDFGRMDIFIESKNKKFAIAIENKIWANDRKDQLKDYNDYLDKEYKNNYKLIYLNPKGENPAIESINEALRESLKEKGFLKILSYEEIIEWLMRCKGVSLSPRVDYFLVELLNYINRKIMGVKDMTEANLIQKAIKESDKTIEVAFQIGKQINNVKYELINKLNDELVVAFRENFPSWKILNRKAGVKGFGIWNAYTGIYLFKSEKSIYGIAFEFDRSGPNNLGFGVTVRDGVTFPMSHPKRKSDVEIRSNLNKKFGTSVESNDWWPWAPYTDIFDKDIANLGFNWGEETEIWAKMNNGTAAIEFIKAFRAVHDTLYEKGLSEIFDYEG